MVRTAVRLAILALLWGVGLVAWRGGALPAAAEGRNWTVPPSAPMVSNPNFECMAGFYAGSNALDEALLIPDGWTLLLRRGAPIVSSTRQFYSSECQSQDGGAFIERLEGWDSLLVRSQDIETNPDAGKPFDVILYQQVDVTPGGVYSLSAWMVSLCGTKQAPFDCPDEHYIAKYIGLEPSGGVDPDSPDVIWVENRRNFVDETGARVGWQNLSLGARALSETMTLFLRMESPFTWHGNMGFMDAVSFVRGPLAAMDPISDTVPAGEAAQLQWRGRESADIASIPNGTHRMLYDVQARHSPADGTPDAWRDLIAGTTDLTLAYTPPCSDTGYEFRVRARAEQPPAPPDGAWPNHRYHGVWSDPVRVEFAPAMALPDPESPGIEDTVGRKLFIPRVMRVVSC